MKKALKIIFGTLGGLILLLMLCILVLYARTQWRMGNEPVDMSQYELVYKAKTGRDKMSVSLNCWSLDELDGIFFLTATNRSGADLEEIVLRVYANGIAAMDGGMRPLNVRSISVDDANIECALDADDPTILRIPYAWKAGETVEISGYVQAQLDDDAPIQMVSLPVLALMEDGQWRTDAWDPLVQSATAEAFDVELRIEFSRHHMLFGGTAIDYAQDPSGDIALVRMLGARDVTLVLAREQGPRYREIGGVRVGAAAGNVFASELLLQRTKTALESLAAAGFKYPFPSLTVIEADTGYADGYAASGLVILPKGGSAEAQMRRLTRLIARQTFGTLVAGDPWRTPWLEHTLSATAELLAYRQRKGDHAFERRYRDEIEVATRLTRPYGVNVGAGTAHFGGETEMTQVLCDQGSAMMLGVEEAMGGEAFIGALDAYKQNYAHQIADQKALEESLDSAGAGAWGGYLADELSN